MDKEIKKQWVKALRSGKYKQARRMLRKYSGADTAFCCLGVLCNLHAQTNPKGISKQKSSTSYFGESAHLPGIVSTWARIDSYNPVVNYHGKELSLAELNDKLRLNFKQIADVIEQQL